MSSDAHKQHERSTATWPTNCWSMRLAVSNQDIVPWSRLPKGEGSKMEGIFWWGLCENLAFKCFRPRQRGTQSREAFIIRFGRPLLLLLVSCAATNNDVSSMQTMKFMHIELQCMSVCVRETVLYVHIFRGPTAFDRIGQNVGSVPWRLMSRRYLSVRNPNFWFLLLHNEKFEQLAVYIYYILYT